MLRRAGKESRVLTLLRLLVGKNDLRLVHFARLETGIGFRNFQRARTDRDDQSYGDSTQLARKEAKSRMSFGRKRE